MNARRLPGRLGRGSFMLEEEMEDGPRVKIPIDPAAAAARFMVRAILADPAVREGAGFAGGAVVVQVPDASWVELVADQWRMLARGGDDPARGDADNCVKPGSWVSFERPGGSCCTDPHSGVRDRRIVYSNANGAPGEPVAPTIGSGAKT